MARIISFVVLIVILLVIAALFFQVMASFLVPVFLALLLVIMFGPLHRWLLIWCRGRERLAAGLTTTAVLLIFLAPLLVVLFQAITESVGLYHQTKLRQVDLQKVSQNAVQLGKHLGLKLDADSIQKSISENIQERLYPFARGTTELLGNLLIGLFVMIVSLYYFLADGRAMVRAISRLSPLDERYKQQLFEQFVNVSRAVVVATLASAIAQGLLAGIGFYLAGFQAVFLLVVLTMLMSMVPFIGPPIIWFPAVLWLYFYEDRTTAAIALGIYGALIVSTVDNIIKPLVLQGRSNLHPLLALLSVLGGVQAMGPIGIFVGPMAVAFLQTLLNILHDEVGAMGNTTGPPEYRDTRR
jgi:predicted PurR-regulated permease PerM